jgi:hypothetical protein
MEALPMAASRFVDRCAVLLAGVLLTSCSGDQSGALQVPTTSGMQPGADMAPLSGSVQGNPISPDFSCKAGAICATAALPVKRNGCFVNNFSNGSIGGTPLTIDLTETGKSGSNVHVYWVNATNAPITITSKTKANYYCPKL